MTQFSSHVDFQKNQTNLCYFSRPLEIVILASKGVNLKNGQKLKICHMTGLAASRGNLSAKNRFRAQNQPRNEFLAQMEKFENFRFLAIFDHIDAYSSGQLQLFRAKNRQKVDFHQIAYHVRSRSIFAPKNDFDHQKIEK